MKQILIILLAVAAPHCTACTAVSGTRILASDLSLADSRYSALPPTLVVAFAPEPGAALTIPAARLLRIARSNGLSVDSPSDVCFEFPVRDLDAGGVRAAIERSLPPEGRLTSLSVPPLKVPAGELHFPLDGLDSGSGRTWRGFVLYSGNRRSPVWATVAVSIPIGFVVADGDLEADTVIAAGSVRLVVRDAPAATSPGLSGVASRLEEVVGRAPRIPLRAGTAIRLSDLREAPAVRRGDSVRVEVRSGFARLHFDAVAEAAARQGEAVDLRNPLNGKTFRARIDAPGTAVLILPSARQSL
jgi:flagella basal body P-ring formation protein FlgA